MKQADSEIKCNRKYVQQEFRENENIRCKQYKISYNIEYVTVFLKRVVREYKMLIEKMGSKIQDVYEDRRAMRIRIPIHPAFLEADDEVSLPDSYEKATKKSSKKKIEQYEKILKLLNDGEWHKTAEIADNLGLKDTRTKELLKELIALDKPIDNGKTKGKLYKLK